MTLEVPVRRCTGSASVERLDAVAVEAPLEIRVNGESLTVTMRTPGADFDLAAGLLLAEGLVARPSDVLVLKRDPRANALDRDNIVLAAIKPVELDESHARNLVSSSSCGICGKRDLAAVRKDLSPIEEDGFRVAAATIYGLNDTMREAQRVFAQTGGLHAAALFDSAGALLSLREDIGRHNAVDKLIGAELLAGRHPLSERIMMVSGRTSYEILQKAAVARLPVLCAVSAPSSMAVEMARALNITLIGFLRGETMNIYAAPERIER